MRKKFNKWSSVHSNPKYYPKAKYNKLKLKDSNFCIRIIMLDRQKEDK
jgi:hypothetical protein